mgnify:CR=1 FL=1
MPDLIAIETRMASEIRLKKGDLARVQRKQWLAVLHAVDILTYASADDIRLRAIQSLSQAIAVYAKLLEIGELEKRLLALEAWRKEQEHGQLAKRHTSRIA